MTCIKGAGPGAGRVLRHRHVDTCGSPQECPGCLPCPEAHCLLCRAGHSEPERVVCVSCLAATRVHLRTALALAGHLTDESLNGQRSGKGDLLGGDALVLAAPAATERGRLAQLLHRTLYGLDVSHTQDESRSDPTPPLAVFLHWEDRFRKAAGHVTQEPASLVRSAAYLDAHLGDAARDLSFVPFARALSGLVRQLEDVLSDGDRPERSRVPCWECGTRLVKVYAATPAGDHWSCPRCGEKYDRGRFDRAKHDHLASEGADRFVYIVDAAAAIGRPEQTVRAWIRRQTVKTQRDSNGRLVAWWPDIRDAHRKAQERRRKAEA